jgi:hypothetical protein
VTESNGLLQLEGGFHNKNAVSSVLGNTFYCLGLLRECKAVSTIDNVGRRCLLAHQSGKVRPPYYIRRYKILISSHSHFDTSGQVKNSRTVITLKHIYGSYDVNYSLDPGEKGPVIISVHIHTGLRKVPSEHLCISRHIPAMGIIFVCKNFERKIWDPAKSVMCVCAWVCAVCVGVWGILSGTVDPLSVGRVDVYSSGRTASLHPSSRPGTSEEVGMMVARTIDKGGSFDHFHVKNNKKKSMSPFGMNECELNACKVGAHNPFLNCGFVRATRQIYWCLCE